MTTPTEGEPWPWRDEEHRDDAAMRLVARYMERTGDREVAPALGLDAALGRLYGGGGMSVGEDDDGGDEGASDDDDDSDGSDDT